MRRWSAEEKQNDQFMSRPLFNFGGQKLQRVKVLNNFERYFFNYVGEKVFVGQLYTSELKTQNLFQ